MNYTLLICISMGLTSLILTGVLRRYALARQIMDIPNERSSHTTPTPRGGGIAIVIAFSIGISIFMLNETLPKNQGVPLLACGLLVAIIGFIDDHNPISARWRLLGHFTAAVLGVFLLGGMPPLIIHDTLYSLGIIGDVLAVFAVVWVLNLYNFMDGIDGIAGSEVVSLCFGMAMCIYLSPTQDASLYWLLLCTSLGFLLWNFPPARIFMGDGGSGFLGLILSLLMLISGKQNPALIWSWGILMGVFTIDATTTLMRRLAQRKSPTQAHCNHAYQHASRHYHSHLKVTFAVITINLFWLLPCAIAAITGLLYGPLALIIAYTPLIGLAFKFKAGLQNNL